MSQGNIIQGQASGKLGDTVLMVRNGKQVARVYTKAGARSGKDASEASRIQRVKFGAASNQWGLYKYVCTRMYRKGKKTTQSDYNYFVKRNNALLPYLTKLENADGVHVLMPGLMSEGNLGRIDLLHSMRRTIGESTINLRVYDSNTIFPSAIKWTATMAQLKAQLAAGYPNASKVTYLFSYTNQIEIEEEGETFVSQQITHDPVSIELFKESSSGEDAMTVKEYFSNKVKSTALAAIINKQTTAIISNSAIMLLLAADTDELSILDTIGVLLFATNENVSDCYSTLLQESSVDPVAGVYAVWSSYRTESSLRIAADSYGFQSGVMRDEIASVGNELSDAVVAHAERLRMVDVEASKMYLEQIGDLSVVKAAQVRKVAQPSESEE